MKLNEIDYMILGLIMSEEEIEPEVGVDRLSLKSAANISNFTDNQFNYSMKKLQELNLTGKLKKGQWTLTPEGRRLAEVKDEEFLEEAYKEFEEEKWTHTGGVKKLGDGLVAKPLIGRHKISTPDGFINQEYSTHEYEALRELEGLPHIPKGVTKQTIDGVPHLVREDLLILEDEDYKTLREEDLIKFEKTIHKAHEEGWAICDNIQIGYSEKQGEYVIYDWSNAHKLEGKERDYNHLLVADDQYLIRLWEDSGFSGYAKVRSWADSERFNQKYIEQVKQAEKSIRPRDRKIPKLNYTYISFARPPHFLGIDFPEGDVIIQDIEHTERWHPFGLIHTEKPLTEEQMYQAELTPTRY